MDYTTVFKIAEKWSVTTACVYYAIKKGRISGAVFIDGRWYIPVNAKNPTKIVAPKAGYISAKKAADKWGITKVAVYTVAKEGRIPGAKFADGRWHIPKDAKEPINKRTARLPGYISAANTARKWGVTNTCVCQAAKARRIPGAKFIDGKWHIPEGTQGTVDGRRKQR